MMTPAATGPWAGAAWPWWRALSRPLPVAIRPQARRPRPAYRSRMGRNRTGQPLRRLAAHHRPAGPATRQPAAALAARLGRSGSRFGCGCSRFGSLFLSRRRPLRPGAGLAHRIEKLCLGADAQQDRVLRRDVWRVPVGPLAHGVDRRLGGAEQLANLRVAQLVIVLEQPGDGVGAVLPLADRRVAGASGALAALPRPGRWPPTAETNRPRSAEFPRG